jgi:hypothetical protein
MTVDLIAQPVAELPPALGLKPGMALPVARYRFFFGMRDALRLPQYSGSLLRGQFGSALRRTACLTGARECAPCPLYHTCPYPGIFETPPPTEHSLQRFSQVPNPYVIEPPPFGLRQVPANDTISFGLVLVGRALHQLPLVAYALQRAFAHGIGRSRTHGDLEDIVLEVPGEAISVWDAEHARVEPHEPALTVPPLAASGAVTLRIETPLRLQNQGHPVPQDKLRPRSLFTALLRRASLLFELHAALPGFARDAARLAAAADRLAEERRLKWVDWTRFSNRQQQEMTLGGAIGEWRLTGDLDELLPWFWLGQWLHVGKNATMGMGRYSLIGLRP